MLTGLPAIQLTWPLRLEAGFCTGTLIHLGKTRFIKPAEVVLIELSWLSLPEDTATVASEIVRKVRFHPTLENFLAILGSPGPVLTVLRAVGPAMVTEPLMVKTGQIQQWNQTINGVCI